MGLIVTLYRSRIGNGMLGYDIVTMVIRKVGVMNGGLKTKYSSDGL